MQSPMALDEMHGACSDVEIEDTSGLEVVGDESEADGSEMPEDDPYGPDFEAVEGTRLLSEAASALLPLPRDGDLVTYVEVDCQGRALSEEGTTYRLGCGLGDTPSSWSTGVDACLRGTRQGEARALKQETPGALPVRVRLLRHVPRRELARGAVLDVTQVQTNMKRASPGMTVFFQKDGQARRRTLGAAPADLEEEALLLLKVGEVGELRATADAETFDDLAITHVALNEDVSALGDGTLWKLSLSLPSGAFERPHLGTRVSALVDDVAKEWAWGLGAVPNELEFATLMMGNGERAEIRTSSAGEVAFRVEIVHLGSDKAFEASEETPEERGCAVAKELYLRGNRLLAWWHWSNVRDVLAPLCQQAAKEEDAEGAVAARRLAARALGNLSVCARQLGRCEEARESASRCLDLLGENWRVADMLRLAKAALACQDEGCARRACERGSARPEISAEEKRGFQTVMAELRASGRAQRATERAFCQRIFAAPAC